MTHPAHDALALWKSLIATGKEGEILTIRMDEQTFNKLDDLLTEALQSASREWMLLDSAPKDGTIIFLSNSDCVDWHCKWHKDKWCFWGIDDFDRLTWIEIQFSPTHWMPQLPLPTPPKQGA